MSKRTNTRNAFETQLTAGIVSGTTTITLDSVSGLIDPLYLVIDPDSSTKREYIRADGIAGSQLTSVTRGLDGSAAGAQDHDAGTRVRAVATHQLVSDIFDDIETIEADIVTLEAADSALAAADAAHFGGTDLADHPEATPAIRGFLSAADKTKLDALNTADQVTGGDSHDHVGGDGAQIDHGGLAGLTDDDHPNLLNDARHTTFHGVVRLGRGGGTQDIPNNTTTVQNYDGVDDNDPSGIFSWVLGTGVLTVNDTGLYMVSASTHFLDPVTSGYILYGIYYDTEVIANITIPAHAAGSEGPRLAVSTVIPIAATVEITARVFQNSGSLKRLGADFDCHLAIARIG